MSAFVLGDYVQLGEGRMIRPPQGWLVSGLVADNLLRLQPPSRVVFYPHERAGASLCWRRADWLIGKPASTVFLALLDLGGVLEKTDLEALVPDLIRLPLESINEGRIKILPGAGSVLAVTYLSTNSQWAGQVIYAPTHEVQGEVQLLSYEGEQVAYLSFLEPAMASIQSFRDLRLKPAATQL